MDFNDILSIYLSIYKGKSLLASEIDRQTDKR